VPTNSQLKELKFPLGISFNQPHLSLVKNTNTALRICGDQSFDALISLAEFDYICPYINSELYVQDNPSSYTAQPHILQLESGTFPQLKHCSTVPTGLRPATSFELIAYAAVNEIENNTSIESLGVLTQYNDSRYSLRLQSKDGLRRLVRLWAGSWRMQDTKYLFVEE
jgi:hypothetical protein